MDNNLNRFDYYSGEPISSPDFMSEQTTNMNIVNSNQQPQQYSYDPNLRYNQMQQQVYQPGSYGYNQQIQQPQQYPYQIQQPFMNPPINPYQPQQPVGYQGNPAFAYMNQMNGGMGFGQPLNLQFEDKVVHVPGFNPGSDVLLPADAEEICSKLQMEMMLEQEEAIEKRNERFQGYFNNNYGGYNYYGMPYLNTWQDQSVTMKYRRMIEDMRQEAADRRKSFNKKLSKLAHNYMGDDIKEEEIDQIYDGYTYTVPGSTLRRESECNRFANMVPVSNQGNYVAHYNEVNKFYNSVVDQNANMQEFLHQQGVLQSYYNLEDEMHRRRDASQYYQGDSYKRFLRKAIRERNGQSGESNLQNNQTGNINGFPVLSNSAQMLEDGSLSITAPSWLGGGQSHIQFNNELEQHFEENRHRFLQSIYAQEGMNPNGT